MSVRSVEVLAAGPLTTVQDRGRPGHSDWGLGRSGAADRWSADLANRLVANPPDAALFEVTAGGLSAAGRRSRDRGAVRRPGRRDGRWTRCIVRPPAPARRRVGPSDSSCERADSGWSARSLSVEYRWWGSRNVFETESTITDSGPLRRALARAPPWWGVDPDGSRPAAARVPVASREAKLRAASNVSRVEPAFARYILAPTRPRHGHDPQGMAEVESAQKQAHPERFDPRGAKGELVEAEHRARYWWAADYVEDKQVLDAGCGTGFGTAILSERRPSRLVGVDISEEAVDRAGDLAPRADELRQADIRELPFADSTFDVVVCFEVIEHIDRQDEALDELRRVLRPTGCLLISSPNRDVYTPGNPHHVHEYAREELESALGKRFDHVALFMQHPWLASAISAGGLPSPEPASGWRIAFVGDELPTGGETYTLAFASASPVVEKEPIVVIGSQFEVRWWNELG